MKKEKKNELGGLFIFNDEKTGQTVYFDFIKKKGYVITSQKKQKYAIWTTRYILEVALTILICTTNKISALYGLGIFVGLLIIGELLFRYRFLYKQTELKQFKPQKSGTIFVRIAKDISMPRAIAIVVLCIALAVVGVINYYVTTYNPYGAIMFLLDCCMAIAGVFIALIYIIVIIIKIIKKY